MWTYLSCMDLTYSQASVESLKPWRITLGQLPIVKLSPTPEVSCSLGCTQGTYLSHQSGMTYQLFVEPCSHKLTLSTAAFPAKTLALRDAEKVWVESEAALLQKSLDSFPNVSPLLSSWKTYLLSGLEGLILLSKNWPVWGMIVDGVLSPLPKSVRITKEKDGSYWPTPQARAGEDCPGERQRKSPNLAACVNMWQTPRANKVEGYASAGYTKTLMQQVTGEDKPLGGRLNPVWVEWLMGYPSGWTACEPWAIAWCRSKREQRSSD